MSNECLQKQMFSSKKIFTRIVWCDKIGKRKKLEIPKRKIETKEFVWERIENESKQIYGRITTTFK